MAHIIEKRILSGDIESRWQQLLDPAQWVESLSNSYGFYYEQLPARFADRQELKFEMSRWYIGQAWRIGVELKEEKKQILLTQKEGPFARWRYHLQLEIHDKDSCLLIESIDYKMRFHLIGGLIDDLYLKQDLQLQLKRRQAVLERQKI